MKPHVHFYVPLLFAFVHSIGHATAADFDQEVAAIIRDYDSANYNSRDNDAKVKAFEALTNRAGNLAKQFPNRAEAMVWHGLSQASLSAADRSLSLAKQARKTLEAAVSMTPNAYVVDAYATLGTMYANVPGFPLSFGDKKKARECFQKALALNSLSLGANSGYAQLLFKQDDYAGALKYATVALNAPPRPGRDQADKAARTSAENVIAKAKAKLQ